MKSFSVFFSASLLWFSSSAAIACDLCAVYSATHAQTPTGPGWSVSTAAQFTHFGTLRLDGDRVADPADQSLDSTITQVVVRRGLTERLSLQLNVPYIVRSYRRPEGVTIDRDRVRGLGDVSLVGRGELVRRDTLNYTCIWDVMAGVKFGTGNTDRITEELSEDHEEASRFQPLHAGHDHGTPAPPSGIHGHDLTLGTGSTDVILGTNFYLSHARLYATASLQYARRSRGDYDYRFGNDVSWELAPGAYLMLGHPHTLGLQLVAFGEHKALDRLGQTPADDTGITSIYLGPRISYTHASNLSAALGVDLSVKMENTALQLTPDYRVRANVTWNF
jgi:hypothetical protein